MKKNNIIVFKYKGTTLNYKVVEVTKECYFLASSHGINEQIFTLLKIEDKFAFCENVIGYPIANKDADFPEVKTLEDLEKIVDALYQRIIDISTPKFKEGERVIIKSRTGKSTDYPRAYTDEMTDFIGYIAHIKKVNIMSSIQLRNAINDKYYEEPYDYELLSSDSSIEGYYWCSAMFESVSKAKDKKEEIPPKFNTGDKVKVKTLDKDHRYGIYLNPDMLKYSNQEFIIADCRSKYATIRNEECDGYSYFLVGVYGWIWSSDMLEKSENKTKHELDTAPWTASESRDLSVMQKIPAETNHIDTILLPPKLAKVDINTQTITFGNIKTIIDTNYKLNFNVKPLKF